MSFYGSIYYQLIDAFYKVILSNKGKNSTDFIDVEKLPESFETQAAGRKSVFGFDTGNKWINLNERTEINQDANEAYSIYEIYHGAPDQSGENPNHGFKVLLDNNTLNNRTKEGVIQLDFNDEFETYETIYDDAGHIAQSERKVYRLPKAEVNERIDNLEELVGLPDGYEDLPEMEETDQHLYGYVNENSKDIKTLESYAGEWDKIVDYWSIGGDYAPTIAEVIGHIDSMYTSPQDRITKHKTFAEIIGNTKDDNLPVLYKKITGKDDYPISLIGSIVSESERIDTLNEEFSDFQGSVNGTFASIDTRFGTPLDGTGKDVYEHIAADRAMIGTPIDSTNDIYDHITTLYDNMNWPAQQIDGQKITVSGEISRLDNKIGTLGQDGKATVASEIARLDDKIGEIPKDFTSLRTYIDTNLEDIEEIFTYDLGENYSEVDDNNIPTKTAFGLIKENADSISSINNFIGKVEGEAKPSENSLITKITNLQAFVGGESLPTGESSLNTHINNVKEYVGYTIPKEGEAITSLTDQINNLGEFIGGTSKGDEEDTLITRISDLEGVIGSDTDFAEKTVIGSILSLTNDIGADTDTGTNTLYSKINDANSSITNLTTLIGSSELSENTENLMTQLSKIHTDLYVSDAEKNTTSLTAKVANCQSLIGTPSANASQEALFTQIEGIKNDIGILTNITTSHDFEEGTEINSIVDILNNILTRLETLEDDVKNLKPEIPNEPNPDEPENGELENGEVQEPNE